MFETVPPSCYVSAFKAPEERLRSVARDYADNYRLHEHWHDGAQLIYATSGVMELTCGEDFWMISPQQALWVPPVVQHQLKARGNVHLRTVYLHESLLTSNFPSTPQSLVVSPLLRELILRAEPISSATLPTSREFHHMQLLLDEIRWVHEIPLKLQMPKDGRLQKICLSLLQNPGDPRNLDDWGQWVGASTRTLSRLFQAELGMSFLLWRQRARVFSALPRLNQRESIIQIAADLGYDSAGAFSTAFRRLMGSSPRDFKSTLG